VPRCSLPSSVAGLYAAARTSREKATRVRPLAEDTASRAPAREAVTTYDAGNRLCRATNDDGQCCDPSLLVYIYVHNVAKILLDQRLSC
jgi:hypothetical protein